MDTLTYHGKNLFMAFLVGGIFSLIGQIIFSFYASFLNPEFLGAATLLSFGIIALIMYIPGLHQKLAPLAGFGLILPFNGFACGIADAYQAGFSETKTFFSGILSALKLFFSVIIIGAFVDFLAGVLSYFATFPQIQTPTPLAGTEALIGSFLVGGITCLIFQFFLEFSKIPVPILLVCGLALGGILTLFGLTNLLSALAPGGFTILVIGAGQAVTATTVLALRGQPFMLLMVLLIFIVLFFIGVICALGNLALKK